MDDGLIDGHTIGWPWNKLTGAAFLRRKLIWVIYDVPCITRLAFSSINPLHPLTSYCLKSGKVGL